MTLNQEAQVREGDPDQTELPVVRETEGLQLSEVLQISDFPPEETEWLALEIFVVVFIPNHVHVDVGDTV